MTQIKASEVSEILKKQLEGFKSDVELEEVGTVLQVGDGIARIYGLNSVQANELIEFDSGVIGIVLNLEEDNVGAVLLGSSELIKEGDSVKRSRMIASIGVGESLLGRVINTLGEPLDGKGPIAGDLIEMPLERKAPVITGSPSRTRPAPMSPFTCMATPLTIPSISPMATTKST